MNRASIRFIGAERKSVSGPGARYWSVPFLAECSGRGPYRGQAAVFQPAGQGDFLGAVPLVPPVLPRWLRNETLSEHLFLYFFNQVQAALTAPDGTLRPLLNVKKETTEEFEVMGEYWLYLGMNSYQPQ
jgi:hypothetical protein